MHHRPRTGKCHIYVARHLCFWRGKPTTNTRMSLVNVTIPRFLLPRLTWKGINPEHQTVIARGLSTWHQNRNHRLLIMWRREFLLGPFRVPSSRPPPNLHVSRNSFWRTHSVSSSSDLAMPLHMSTLSFASTFNNKNSRIIRRSFSTNPQLLRDHHFDTLKCVQRLKAEGFSEEQSKAMMVVLSDVIEESIQNLTRTMVLREGYPSSSSFLFYIFKYLY